MIYLELTRPEAGSPPMLYMNFMTLQDIKQQGKAPQSVIVYEKKMCIVDNRISYKHNSDCFVTKIG